MVRGKQETQPDGDTRLGPQRSNPTSDEGQFPHPKDQHEDDEEYDEFWQAQMRHESHFPFTREGEPEKSGPPLTLAMLATMMFLAA